VALHFASCTASGAYGIHSVPARDLAADIQNYSQGKMTLAPDPLYNSSGGHSLITMMVYMECDVFLLGKHTWSEVVFQVPHVKRATCTEKSCTHFLAQPSCYTTCSLAVLGDSILAWSSKEAPITPINSSIWHHGLMTSKDKQVDVISSAFEPTGAWMNATAPAAVVHPAWKALMDATSKLSMIGLQKAIGRVECSSMVYKWDAGARVRPLAGTIKIERDVGMSNTLPAGSKVAYDGTDGASMQVETEFVMGFPEVCASK